MPRRWVLTSAPSLCGEGVRHTRVKYVLCLSQDWPFPHRGVAPFGSQIILSDNIGSVFFLQSLAIFGRFFVVLSSSVPVFSVVFFVS